MILVEERKELEEERRNLELEKKEIYRKIETEERRLEQQNRLFEMKFQIPLYWCCFQSHKPANRQDQSNPHLSHPLHR